MTKKSRALFLPALLSAAVVFAAPARADIAPNPGGSVVVTNSTSAGIAYDNVPVTQRVDIYATTLLTFLNGGQIGSQSFALAFSDPTVQSAVSSADSILSGDGAGFGAPIQDSLLTALFSSVAGPPAPTYSCTDFSNGAANYPPGTSVTGNVLTNSVTFGPAFINVGDCQADTFTVLAGQEDININTENDFLVTQNVLTTNTYLTTAVYEIDGITQQGPGGPVSVPEAGTMGMLAAGLGGLVMLRRRRRFNRTS